MQLKEFQPKKKKSFLGHISDWNFLSCLFEHNEMFTFYFVYDFLSWRIYLIVMSSCYCIIGIKPDYEVSF